MDGKNFKRFVILFLVCSTAFYILGYLFLFDMPKTYEAKIWEPGAYKFIRIILSVFVGLVFATIINYLYKKRNDVNTLKQNVNIFKVVLL